VFDEMLMRGAFFKVPYSESFGVSSKEFLRSPREWIGLIRGLVAKMSSAAVARTLYRALLRGSERVRSSMRAGHVVIVAEVVQRFAAHSRSSSALSKALADQGPLPLSGLVRHTFRNSDGHQSPDKALRLDTAFSAMRSMALIEEFVMNNNKLFDSLEGLSDRETPEMPRARLVASAILRDAALPRELP